MNFYPIKNAFLQISNLLRPLSQLCPNKKHSLAHSQLLLVTVNLYSCCWAVLGWVEPYILSSNSVKYSTFYMYKIFHNRSIPESMLLSFVTVLPVCRQKIYSAEIFQDKMFDEIIMTLGHLYCSLLLFMTSLITEQFSCVVRWLVSVVSSVTGIQKNSPKVSVV